ncbi:MAG: creatininase family protein [bacterium]
MKTFNYVDLTYLELEALDRANTVFLSAISPLETHGAHLPLGTDIFIAESLRDLIARKLDAKYPELQFVILPTLALGSDAIPVKGSVRVRYKAILGALLDTGQTLSSFGFKYWILTDNHGGPHHQMAIELAGRELAGKKLNLIAPFNTLFRRMVAHDPDLLEKTGLGPGSCGDSADAHGGTNETSLMLAIAPEKIREIWKQTGPGRESAKQLPFHLLSGISKILRSLGANDAATDFDFLAHGLTWVSDPKMEPYQGNPSIATKEAGEAMINYHADLGVELFEQARAGKQVFQKPLGWSIRALRDLI